MAIDLRDNLYVLDAGNFCIRRITADGSVTTLAGGQQGYADGNGLAAEFYNPTSIAADGAGNIYVAEQTRLRKITAAGIVTTLAGSPTQGYADGVGVNALFYFIDAIAIDALGNIVVLDKSLPENNIRIISPTANVSTFTPVSIFSFGIAMDDQQNLFITEQGIWEKDKIMKITPAKLVTQVANSPRVSAITMSQGFIFLAGNTGDINYNYPGIYKIISASNYSLLAGGTRAGFLDGDGNTTQFSSTAGIAVDSKGNLYVSDKDNNRIRKVSKK